MKDFSNIRNKLLHGHAISTIFDSEGKRHSDLKRKINPKVLKEQVAKFRLIMEGMRFYLDCLDSTLTESGKKALKQEYLSNDFLPYLR